MPPTLSDYNYAFGDSGVVLNTDSLPFVDVLQVSGLDNAPSRITTDEHQGMDGTYIDNPFMSARTIVVTGEVYTSPSDPDTLLKTLRASYQTNTITPFYFQHPGQGLQFINGKGGGCVYDIDANRRIGKTPIQLTVLCGDPYIYDYPASTGVVQVPTVTTVGTGFNMAFNVGFGGTIPTFGATVYNNGTHTAYPKITLNGQCTNPTFVDSYGVTMPFNLSMAATDSLVIDCRNRSIVLNGQVSRRSAMTGLKWFSVPPGMSTTIFFGAASGTASATVTLNSTYY